MLTPSDLSFLSCWYESALWCRSFVVISRMRWNSATIAEVDVIIMIQCRAMTRYSVRIYRTVVYEKERIPGRYYFIGANGRSS